MCTELILSFLYFFFIFVINCFLFQILTYGLKKAIFYRKVKCIFVLYYEKKTRWTEEMSFLLVSFLIFAFELSSYQLDFWNLFLFSIKEKKNCRDMLIIGKLFNYLNGSSGSKTKLELLRQKTYFFELVENQYLSMVNKKQY